MFSMSTVCWQFSIFLGKEKHSKRYMHHIMIPVRPSYLIRSSAQYWFTRQKLPKKRVKAYLDVSRSEQELPIQVWFLNGVHICDKQVSWSTARQSYHSKVFKMFTSYSTSSNLQGQRNARKDLKRQRCILITAKFTFWKMTVKFYQHFTVTTHSYF